MNTYLVDSMWSSPYEGYQCAHPYTYDVKHGCDGWNNVDLHTCKEYCRNNKLPSKCKVAGPRPVCTHLIWYEKTKWCHLAEACTMKANKGAVVIKKLTQGIV